MDRAELYKKWINFLDYEIKKDKILISLFFVVGMLAAVALIIYIIGTLPIFNCGHCVTDFSCPLWEFGV